MSELMARHDDIYKKRFLRVSDYIFSFVEEDVFALEQARQLGGFDNLTHKKKKPYEQEYARKRIAAKKMILSKILGLTSGISRDETAKQSFRSPS